LVVFKIQPVPKPRMVHSDRYKGRPIVVRYFDYCDNLRMLSVKNKFSIGDKIENLTFVLKMPKSWSNKKKEEYNNTPHQQKPDLDNLLKAFKDALLSEDSKVHTYINISKVWGYSGAILIKDDI